MEPPSKRARLKKTEADTNRRTRLFSASDETFPATFPRQIYKREDIDVAPVTGRKRLQQREEMGDAAYRRTRPQSAALGIDDITPIIYNPVLALPAMPVLVSNSESPIASVDTSLRLRQPIGLCDCCTALELSFNALRPQPNGDKEVYNPADEYARESSFEYALSRENPGNEFDDKLQDKATWVIFGIPKYSCDRFRTMRITQPKFIDLLPAPATVNSPESGTFVARIIGEALEPKLINEWVHGCQNLHVGTCPPISTHTFDFPFWAIDVVDMRLCTIPDDALYIALSYVWGPVEASVTTKDNLSSRQQIGGLHSTIKVAAQVIKDSVALVRGMGHRYLWIDQLCVIRGEDDLLKQTLRAMGQIYRCAFVTIVAATGKDANAGLPGVREGSRPQTQLAYHLGHGSNRVALVNALNSPSLEGTAYMERAWT
ncbi:hypothetical protein W97_06231 [Coniosporium apollinis CBS 100218]|uniref:Heterokaryon incompatibility domain-containing protein n=1 Tax=Coniosporium apollinis (strain CBS 100218) TaxID=1168221 RepID=R7YYG5_CONA1|nr:uncharacterized protein W97_06231 [Coniosporium apollinis CBS 100218]EON66829.1 hypothetical protein W97_06231 [Coniosporium apollinis CBS 100218]